MNDAGDAPQSDPLREVAQAILAHPRFTPAVLVYVDEITKWRRGLGRFAWAATSYVGTHIVGFVLLLHYANTTGEPEGGATFTRLLAQCQRRNLCGAGALRTVLTLATVAGYLKSSRGADKRVQIFAPTEKLLAKSCDLYRCPMAALDQLVDGAAYADQVRADAGFIPRMITSAGQQYIEHDILVADNFPHLLELMYMTGGCLVVLALVEAELRGHPCPSTRTVGQQCGVSASQVREILRRASAHGLVALSADGQVASAAALTSMYRQFVARELALYAKYTLGLEPHFVVASSGVRLKAAE